MSKLSRLRSFFLPAVIGLTLAVVAGWYYLAWLPSESKYLDDRNFRVLTTLGEQISASINNFDKMMDNASDSGVTSQDHMLEDYLRQVAPQFKAVEIEDMKVVGEDYGDPPNIAVRADEGTHFLYFAFQRTSKEATTKYAVRTDLDKVIRDFLPPADRNPFDVLLVTQSDGTVIFQKSASGLAIARVDALGDESGVPKTGKPEPGNEKGQSQSPRLLSSKFSEVTLAGVVYRLYSQPLPLSLQLIVPGKLSAEDKTLRRPEQWVLCGLVRADTFRSESQSISYTYILWVSACILLALLAPPSLKLLISTPAERLRARDVVVTVVFACVAAATGTFILLDLQHWRKDFDESAERQMHDLAEAINTNFKDEQEVAFKQLSAFSKDEMLAAALGEAQVPTRQRPQFDGNEGACKPKLACRIQILASDDSATDLSLYPYLQFASWSDFKGNQRVKWTTRSHVTPFINLDDPSISYYPSIKRAFGDPGAWGANPASTRGIESEYSSNTGENITIFWELLGMDGNPVKQKVDPKNVFCASLVTHPISVIHSIMPAEFQFAIIKADGTVIFHSDRTRNLRENFFAESGQNAEVRLRVSMRSAGMVVSKYMGRGHRLFISPMSANPYESWTVIVFRDLRVEQTMNLEVLSLAAIMFVLYTLVMALALILAHWTQRGRERRNWLWPDSQRAGTYRRLVIVNGIAILLLLICSEIPTQPALLFCATFIPVATIIANLVALKRQADGPGFVDRPEGQWQFSYIATFFTLLVAVAVLPCLFFFKVAWNFEEKLFVERNQLRLIEDVNSRRQIVRSYYQGVQLGGYAELLLAEPEGQKVPKFSYQQSFLATEIHPGEAYKKPASVRCGLGSTADRERCVELFLGAISPLYNEIAYEGRYLTEASLDSRTWSLISSEGRKEIQLTRREPNNKVWTISSSWTPLQIRWGYWKWWLGAVPYLAVLFLLVRFMLRKIFLLDLHETSGGQAALAGLQPGDLLRKLSKDILVIGRDSSPTIVNLLQPRKEVQICDFYQLWNVQLQGAAAQGGGASGRSAPSDPIGDIVEDGRPVVFRNFESGLEEPGNVQRILSALETVLSRLQKTVVLISRVDPLAKSSGEEREQMQRLLRSFVRIDLNLGPARCAGETGEEFETRISEAAYYDWLFSGRPKLQKLVLVHLAQEKLINPNSYRAVGELMREGLIVRSHGMLSIFGAGFANFLKSAVPQSAIKHWEKQGAGIHVDALRTSLLVAGTALALFLVYTQGALVDTWVKYATGLAASIPVFLKLLGVFRSGGTAETQAH
jgi:hypothetical protein